MTPGDFFTRQRRNRVRSAFLLTVFVAFVGLLGIGVDAIAFDFLRPGGSVVPLSTAVALGLAAALAAVAYYRGAEMVLASLCARPLDPEVAEQRQLHNVVAEMALAAGLPQPRVYLIPDTAPNALATGRDPTHAAVAVTQGLLNLCDRAETQGVVAHELAHVGNRDTRTMTLVASLFGGALMLSDWARRTLYFGTKRARTNVLVFVVILLTVAVTPLLSRILAMAVSRQREYLADATAAQLTRNPLGLASALEKIGYATSPLRAATRGTAHLFISSPWPAGGDRRGPLAGVLDTHPPLRQRIAILRAMGGVD
jgi:heat shock protein HtpX